MDEKNINENEKNNSLTEKENSARQKEVKGKDISSEEIKSKYKTALIIALAALLTLNIILGFFGFLYYRHTLNVSAEKIEEKLKKELFDNLYDDAINNISEKVLQGYIREYYLPEDYFSIGLYVNKNTRASVVEVLGGYNATSPIKRSTGIILNEDGYIVTNAHAVTYTSTHVGGDINNPNTTIIYHSYPVIQIIIHNEIEKYEVTVIDYDIPKDLALLKLTSLPENIKPVTFGNSDYVNVGEDTVLMGNTLGMGITVSLGSILGCYSYNEVQMLQVDALTLEGNSGAGLFNPLCEAVGVLSFRITGESNLQSVGYAITSNEVINYIQNVAQENDLEIEYTLSDNIPDFLPD